MAPADKPLPSEALRLERLSQLQAKFGGDKKLINAIMYAISTCEQMPVLADAYKRTLLEIFEATDDETGVAWEKKAYVDLGDVLNWAARLEMAMHDLRSSL